MTPAEMQPVGTIEFHDVVTAHYHTLKAIIRAQRKHQNHSDKEERIATLEAYLFPQKGFTTA